MAPGIKKQNPINRGLHTVEAATEHHGFNLNEVCKYEALHTLIYLTMFWFSFIDSLWLRTSSHHNNSCQGNGMSLSLIFTFMSSIHLPSLWINLGQEAGVFTHSEVTIYAWCSHCYQHLLERNKCMLWSPADAYFHASEVERVWSLISKCSVVYPAARWETAVTSTKQSCAAHMRDSESEREEWKES